MDDVKIKGAGFFKTFKKLILVAVMGIAGFLLILAGLGLVQLSLTLILYIGLILLIFAVIYHFIG